MTSKTSNPNDELLGPYLDNYFENLSKRIIPYAVSDSFFEEEVSWEAELLDFDDAECREKLVENIADDIKPNYSQEITIAAAGTFSTLLGIISILEGSSFSSGLAFSSFGAYLGAISHDSYKEKNEGYSEFMEQINRNLEVSSEGSNMWVRYCPS